MHGDGGGKDVMTMDYSIGIIIRYTFGNIYIISCLLAEIGLWETWRAGYYYVRFNDIKKSTNFKMNAKEEFENRVIFACRKMFFYRLQMYLI